MTLCNQKHAAKIANLLLGVHQTFSNRESRATPQNVLASQATARLGSPGLGSVRARDKAPETYADQVLKCSTGLGRPFR